MAIYKKLAFLEKREGEAESRNLSLSGGNAKERERGFEDKSKEALHMHPVESNTNCENYDDYSCEGTGAHTQGMVNICT
jgi:hypothetical protein